MNQSERKLRGILGLNRPFYIRFIDNYVERPLLFDLVISIVIVKANDTLIYFECKIFTYDKDSIKDILNELISSSLSAAGFALAALALIASINQTVPEVKKGEKPKSGKEYFFNSIGYKKVVRLYLIACIVFLCNFLFFTFLRGIDMDGNVRMIHGLTLFGTSYAALTFLRCILFVWALIQIK